VCPSRRRERLFTDFGEKTIERIGEGCLCMAEIWASAWKERLSAFDVSGEDDSAAEGAEWGQSRCRRWPLKEAGTSEEGAG